MTNAQKNSIASAMSTQKFKKNDVIVAEGDQASSYYIIKKGTVSCLRGNEEVRKMYQGESFGEQALSFNTNRTLSVRAAEDTICLALGRETLLSVLGDKVANIARSNLQRWAFQKHPVLSKLTQIQIEKLIDNMKVTDFKAGGTVFRKGGSQNCFVIILGTPLYFKEKQNDIYADRGTIVGDKEMLEGKSSKYDCDTVFLVDGSISYISFSEFEKVIGGKVKTIL